MLHLSESEVNRIAAHLITFKNQKARQRLKRNQISPAQLFALGRKELADLGLQSEEIENIKVHYRQIAEQELQKCRENHIHIVFAGDECYPGLLSEIYDPPDFIYVKGDKEILRTEKISVVGSRRATTYGRRALNTVLPDLCQAGLTVVSGMAYGIDAEAHKIALRTGGRTIGVNAGGLLHLYPAGNIALLRQIEQDGCIISEFPTDIVPRPFYFPVRNRIIAGVSRAVLVVEAARKSGSLITARLALEQNRDVLAIPGPIDSPLSQGTHYLIQQGAKLVTAAADILEEYGLEYHRKNADAAVDFSPKEIKILDLMGENEVKSIDDFVDHTDLSVAEILSLLMGLSLKNVVIEVDGGYKRLL
jgi:DNA processing protein